MPHCDAGPTGYPPSAPLAAFVGRVVAEKNIRFLLEVLSSSELSDAYLLVIGDGSERRALEDTAERLRLNGRVRFIGQVAPAEVPAYVALADFSVTASKIEVLPTAILETLGVGLPVLGMDVPWIRAVIRSGENGLLTPPDDAAAMARAWAHLAHDRELRERLAAGARRTGEQYDARLATARLVAHCEQLCPQSLKSMSENSCGVSTKRSEVPSFVVSTPRAGSVPAGQKLRGAGFTNCS